jgi:uncharacterized membrane protein YkvA (DUF1232 family)
MNILRTLNFSNKGYRFFRNIRKEGITADSFLDNVAALWRMFRQYFSGNYSQMRKRTLVKVVAGFLYLIFFIDLIPDFIPFIGWMDDIAVLFFIYRSLKDEITRFRNREATRKNIIHI